MREPYQATFNAKLLQPILLTARHHRLSVTSLLAQLNIDSLHLDTPGKRYPLSVLATLLKELSLLSENPAFAVRAAEATQPRMLGNLGFAMSTANTFFDACQTLADYSALAFEGIRIKLESQDQQSILSLELEQQDDHVTAFFIGCLCNWSRWLTGRQIPAQSIKLMRPQAADRIFEQHLASEIQFASSANQVIFDNRYLSTPCLEANSEMHQLHCQFADSLLEQSSLFNAIVSQTKVQIRQLITLRDQNPLPIRREDIAARLNMSLRTFQRKLHEVQRNFQEIYDQVRRESCLTLMTNEQLSIGQISYRLGFANPSALQKAFKRWMSITAREYRQRLASQKTQLNNTIEQPVNTVWFSQLKGEELRVETQQRLDQLSDFSIDLLAWLACLQRCAQSSISLAELAELSNNSIARLSIYIWPAQQQGLLAIDENSDAGATRLLLQPDILIALILQHSHHRASEHHYCIGHHALHDQQSIEKVIQHFSYCQPTQLNATQCEQLYHSAQTLLEHPDIITNTSRKAKLLYLLITYSDPMINSVLSKTQLHFALLLCEIELEQWEKCSSIISWLSERELTDTQQLQLVIYRTQLMAAHYQFKEAVTLLLLTLNPLLSSALDDNSNSALINISQKIDYLELTADCSVAESDDSHDFKHVLTMALQQLILVALKARTPLVAANATCAMLPLADQLQHKLLRAFAYSHFSWICSWFGGHGQAAFITAQRALDSLDDAHSRVYLDCIFVLYSRVYHWFTPLQQEVKQLSELLKKQHSSPVEHLILLQQIRLCSGVPLNDIHLACTALNQTNEQEHQDSTCPSALTRLCADLLASKPRGPITEKNNFHQLFKAFYRADYTEWPALLHIAQEIENDTPSHFIAIEANFICLIMQIHCAHLSQQSSLTNRRIEAGLARFDLWAQQCPENFAAPFALAQAIHSGFTQPLAQAMMLFEQALVKLNDSGYLHHKMIAYRHYALLLNKEHSYLSSLCSEQQKTLLTQWLGG